MHAAEIVMYSVYWFLLGINCFNVIKSVIDFCRQKKCFAEVSAVLYQRHLQGIEGNEFMPL